VHHALPLRDQLQAGIQEFPNQDTYYLPVFSRPVPVLFEPHDFVAKSPQGARLGIFWGREGISTGISRAPQLTFSARLGRSTATSASDVGADPTTLHPSRAERERLTR
jgi:hypothetical protein